MRIGWTGAMMALLLSTSPARAAGGPATVVRDWGLHRAWRVERDPAHPAGPARLVEIPWSAGAGVAARASTASGRRELAAPKEPAMVRAGARVTVWRRGQVAEVRLAGTALESGRLGETIPVRAGLRHGTLRGVVRGPASVELIGGKDWQ